MSLIFFLRPAKDYDVGGYIPPQKDFQKYLNRWEPKKNISAKEELKVLAEHEKEITAKVEYFSEQGEKRQADMVLKEKVRQLELELINLKAYREVLEDEMLFILLISEDDI